MSCQDVLSNPVVELTVRPGEDVTLYCDCKLSANVNIVWYRNCSHENQPTLTLNWKDRHHGIFDYIENGSNFSNLNMMWNDSSNSYNLLIKNITDSHLGLYYCGTEKREVNKENYIYTYGRINTRISFGKWRFFLWLNSEKGLKLLSCVGIICKCVACQALFKDGQDVLIGDICATIPSITITFRIPN